MLARKFSSEGRIRCPTPWRARNATRLPRSVPITYGPEGSPKGVVIVFSSRSLTSDMSYRPLPPMMPISMLIAVYDALSVPSPCPWSGVSAHRRDNPALPILFANVARRDRWIVLEEDKNVLRHRLFHELLLRAERVHRIQVAAHDPGIRRVRQRCVIICQVARAVPLVRLQRIVPLAAADDVLGARKPGSDPPRAVTDRKAAGVVEMQMAGEDDVDVLGRESGLGERVVEI